jgi:hypothetical protein
MRPLRNYLSISYPIALGDILGRMVLTVRLVWRLAPGAFNTTYRQDERLKSRIHGRNDDGFKEGKFSDGT